MLYVENAIVNRIAALRVSACLCRKMTALPSNSFTRSNIRHFTLLASNEPTLLQSQKIILCQVQNYAKSKDKKGKGYQGKSSISDEEMSEVIDVTQLRKQFSLSVENLKEDYIKKLTLRTAAGGIETLQVELEGDKYPLREIAQVSRKSSQMLLINVSAFPQAAKGVFDALEESGMNLNPQQEGTTIYVPLPRVTKEHRESLAKNAKVLCNRCKEQLREKQNNFVRKAKDKNGSVSADLVFNTQLKIRELYEQHVQEAEKLLATKQKELLKTN